jgi:vancomycin resistance protein YoaR
MGVSDVTQPERPAPGADGAPPTEVLPTVESAPATQVLPAAPGAVPPPDASSPLGDLGTEPKRRVWPKVLLGLGIAVVVLAGAYGAAAYYLGDKVPKETSVAGVEIGGMTVAQAEAALTEGLAERAAQPVVLVVDGANAQVDPAAVGLAFDAEATVDQFTGFTLAPQVLLGHLLGLGEQPAVSTVDEADLEAAIGAITPELDVAPVEGAITFAGTEAQAVQPEDGVAVDVEATAERVRETWLEGTSVTAVTSVVEPTIDAEAVQSAMDTIVRPLTSAPISVTIGEAVTPIPLETLLAVSRIEAEGTDLVLRIDGEALKTTVYELTPGIGEQPKDATVRLENGAPVVVPAVAGVGIDAPTLAAAATTAALSTTDRTAVVDLVPVEPEFTTEQAQALGIVEKVSEFSTPMPYDPVRTQNLITGTSIINGDIVLPGETFSLIDALGPITASRGFTLSHVVVDGNVSEALGGGLSQLATTTYNAAYFAGMDDVYHKPHSRWFDRYPEGREATMFTPSIDLKWRNNTDYGVLVQAWVAGGRTHVAFWSTKVWDVTSVTGPRYNITAPRTVYNTSANCTPESGGQSGFTVKVTRTRERAGQAPETQTWTTTYQPWNRIVCGAAP